MGVLRRIGRLLRERGGRFAFYKVCHAGVDMVRGILAARHFLPGHVRPGSIPGQLPISVLVPVYSPVDSFFREMLDSVSAQSYGSWELCLADGSPAGDRRAEQICRGYMARDGRIRYVRLAENRGIAGNSNACAEMARGEYLLLLDQDDRLHPEALAELAVRAEGGADFVYGDEMVFSWSFRLPRRVHWKPDFSQDDLLGNNYICHPVLFRAALFREAGGFRSGFDGAQDHELFLRLTALARQVVHVPRVLYFWRSHAGSVASGIGAKSYAQAAGQRAVEDFLHSAGCMAEVEEVPPSIYRVHFPSGETAEGFSVVIPCRRLPWELLAELEAEPLVREIVCVSSGSGPEGAGALSGKARQVVFADAFDYGRMAWLGAQAARSPFLLFLAEDMRLAAPGTLAELLSQVRRPETALIGSLTLRGRKLLQAGLRRDASGSWRLEYRGADEVYEGYMRRLLYTHAVEAVLLNGAAVRREVLLSAAELSGSALQAGTALSLAVSGRVLIDVYARWQEI